MKSQVKPIERELDEPRPAPLWHRGTAFALKGLLAVLILVAAAYAGREILVGAPGADRKDRPRVARLVEVVPAAATTQGPLIEAWGEVVPARTLSLRPEVGGRVVWINPALTPGGRVAKGEELLRLDDRTLALELARAEAVVRQIAARVRIEDGQQRRAASDLARVPTKLTEEQRSLVLREPQMAELQAELAAAEAARDSAGVALSMALVSAPFDATVVSEQVAEGTSLGANSEAAVLVGSDHFRVELAVPITALAWIDPEGGQTVRLTQPKSWGEDVFRVGRMERLSPDLTDTGRMAEVMITVPDPLAQEPAQKDKPALLLGSFLRAEIEGRPVENAVALPRAYLRDGSSVWVMNEDDRLEIRDVAVVWRGAETVLVSAGLEPGERVVATHLATVADGMKLRLDGHSEAEAGAVAQKPAAAEGG